LLLCAGKTEKSKVRVDFLGKLQTLLETKLTCGAGDK